MTKPWLKTTTAALALVAGLASLPALAAEAPVQGGSIIVTYKDDMATLDPAIGYDWQNWSMINALFSRLVDYKPGTTEIVPSLADSYTVSDDGLTYTFKLNPNAKFTNGRKVVAADVKYSIERAVNPKTQGPGAAFFHSIARRRQDDRRLCDHDLRHRGAGRGNGQVHPRPAGRHLPQRAGAELRFGGPQGGGRGRWR